MVSRRSLCWLSTIGIIVFGLGIICTTHTIIRWSVYMRARGDTTLKIEVFLCSLYRLLWNDFTGMLGKAIDISLPLSQRWVNDWLLILSSNLSPCWTMLNAFLPMFQGNRNALLYLQVQNKMRMMLIGLLTLSWIVWRHQVSDLRRAYLESW